MVVLFFINTYTVSIPVISDIILIPLMLSIIICNVQCIYYLKNEKGKEVWVWSMLIFSLLLTTFIIIGTIIGVIRVVSKW
jgi:hypothetical protein